MPELGILTQQYRKYFERAFQIRWNFSKVPWGRGSKLGLKKKCYFSNFEPQNDPKIPTKSPKLPEKGPKSEVCSHTI